LITPLLFPRWLPGGRRHTPRGWLPAGALTPCRTKCGPPADPAIRRRAWSDSPPWLTGDRAISVDRGRRRRPLPKIRSSWALWPRREYLRSCSIGGKDLQPMESPRSRLVTWSCARLSFLGRRFWRPHPDLDRSATPALPPGGGRPFCEGRFALLVDPRSTSPPARKAGRPPYQPGH